MIIKIFLSFFLTFLSVYFIEKIARLRSWLSYPRENRWHSRPVALYGGIGIVFGLYIPLFFPPYPEDFFVLFLILSFFAFLLGLWDDIKPLSPSLKFLLQIILASFVVLSGARISITGRFLIDIFITYFWILGITNAFNLLDNMDGLSAGIGIIVACFLFFLFLYTQSPIFPILFLSLLIASYGAYLIFNFPPAKIFMGDAGSLFLGFSLSVISIPGYLNKIPYGITSFLSILLIFSLPIFDTILVTLNRLYYGKKASEGGKDHTSHRLIFLGFSEPIVNFVLYAISAVGGFLGVYLYLNPGVGEFLSIIYVLFLFFFGRYISRLNVYHAYPQGIVFVLEELFARIKASEIIIDTVIIGSAYYFAFFMHYEGIKKMFADTYVATLSVAIFVSLLFLFIFGIYKESRNPLSFEKIEKLISSVIFSDISIKFFSLWFLKKDVKWEVLITYDLLWFFLFVFSRGIFSYFDHIIKRVKEKKK